MDQLTIKSISFHGAHGAHEEERRNGNWFEVDVALRGDFSAAASADRLESAIDYQRIEAVAARILRGPSRHLIETLCYQIGERLIKDLPELVDYKLVVTLRKLNPALNSPTAHTEIRMQWPRP